MKRFTDRSFMCVQHPRADMVMQELLAMDA